MPIIQGSLGVHWIWIKQFNLLSQIKVTHVKRVVWFGLVAWFVLYKFYWLISLEREEERHLFFLQRAPLFRTFDILPDQNWPLVSILHPLPELLYWSDKSPLPPPSTRRNGLHSTVQDDDGGGNPLKPTLNRVLGSSSKQDGYKSTNSQQSNTDGRTGRAGESLA